MNIQVHIERLVVDRSLGLDSRALEAAVIEGLSQALVQQSELPLLQLGGSIRDMDGGAIHFEQPISSWGQQFGHSFDAALAGDARPNSKHSTEKVSL